MPPRNRLRAALIVAVAQIGEVGQSATGKIGHVDRAVCAAVVDALFKGLQPIQIDDSPGTGIPTLPVEAHCQAVVAPAPSVVDLFLSHSVDVQYLSAAADGVWPPRLARRRKDGFLNFRTGGLEERQLGLLG